ncbi:MAG: PASTA domain-containing protein [Mucinivorans sp.]
MNFLRKIFDYIKGHFLLRNLVLAVCLIVVFIYAIEIFLGLFTRHGQSYEVPALVGMTVEQATATADNLRIEVIDSLFVPREQPGAILDQSPNAGMGVKAGRTIFVVINAERPRMEVVPYVTGFSLRQAKNMLESKGFEIGRLVYSADMATNNILDEHCKATRITQNGNFKAEMGSAITLTVGLNGSSPLPLVPKVVGLTLRQAKSRLWEMGLNLGDVRPDGTLNDKDDAKAKVYRQSPNQQTRADYGQSVTLYLTADIDKIKDGGKESDVKARHVEQDVDSMDMEDIFKL